MLAAIQSAGYTANQGFPSGMVGAMRRTPTFTAAFIILAALPFSLEGQDGGARLRFEESVQVHGTVVDQTTGDPVPSARVVLSQVGVQDTEPLWSGGTDGNGRFRTTRLPLGAFQVQVSVLSFSPVSHIEVLAEAGDIDIRIEMAPVDFALEPVIVTARRETRLDRTGFYQRAQRGLGHFITRSEIEAVSPRELSDVFRQIPGVSIIPAAMGPGAVEVRLRGRCEPQVILDGTPLANPVYIDGLISPSEVEGVEVHHGATVPIQYQQRSTCGTVMLWSRDTGAPTAGKVSLKGFLGAVGFIVLAVFSTG